MPNGKPLIPDVDALGIFAEPFIVDDVPRDLRLARKYNCAIKQVYAAWNKRRFDAFIEYGVTLRSGWLTPQGKEYLRKLKEQDL